MTDADLNRRAEEAKADIEKDLQVLDAEDAEEAKRASEPKFEALGEGRYRLSRPGLSVEVDFLRRSGGALRGEVIIKTTIPGARTSGDILSGENMNLSSSRARRSFGLYLKERSKVDDFDWVGLVEDVCIRVLDAERKGAPAVWLNDMPEPEPDQVISVEGMNILRHQPTCNFGDGGCGKSMFALWLLGKMRQQGLTVGFFDWELDQNEHRRRLGQLFGTELPEIRYVRCTRPFVHEADRLRRIVRDDRLDYVVLDSVSYACDGPAETHEQASKYVQSLRSLGEVGSWHCAHVTKSSVEGNDRKPFGSVFWHNSMRSTWYIKTADAGPEDDKLTVGIFNRKANIGAKQPSVGFEFRFDGRYGPISVRRVDLGDVADLARQLPAGERIRLALRSGARTRSQLKNELDDLPDSTFRGALREGINKGRLIKFPDSQDGKKEWLALPERRFE